MMRRVVIGAAAALAVSGLAACGSSGAGGSGGSSSSASAASCTYSGIQSELYQKGALTVATDKPV